MWQGSRQMARQHDADAAPETGLGGLRAAGMTDDRVQRTRAAHAGRATARRASGWLAVVAAGVLLAGCAATDKDPTANWTAEQLYADAKADLDAGNWASAIKGMERLESRYPFGSYAQQAQLDIAWAHYKEGDRAEALSSIDRFIWLHPAHERLDYAYYLKGLVNFSNGTGLIARWAGQDASERDLAATREAYDAFQQVVNRFPQSRYREDSIARMRSLVNSMASGEVHVARFYLSRGAYVASANRAQGVLSSYQGTPATEDALNILATSYDRLNLPDLRDDTVRVMARTWPQSAYLKNFPKPKDPDPNTVRPADANMAPLQTAPLIPDLPESLRQNPDLGGSDSGSAPAPNPMQGVPGI